MKICIHNDSISANSNRVWFYRGQSKHALNEMFWTVNVAKNMFLPNYFNGNVHLNIIFLVIQILTIGKYGKLFKEITIEFNRLDIFGIPPSSYNSLLWSNSCKTISMINKCHLWKISENRVWFQSVIAIMAPIQWIKIDHKSI